MKVRSIRALIREAQRRIDRVTEADAKSAAIDAQLAAIGVAVYDSYTPVMYERRGERGGMGDPKNIACTKVRSGHAIEMENVTPFKGSGQSGSLARLIYGGDGYRGMKYDYPSNPLARTADRYPYLAPRDFMTPAREKTRGNLRQVYMAAAERAGLELRG